MASSRKIPSHLIIAVICIPIFIGALDLTVVSAVLPHVIYDLEIPMQTGWDDAAWMVSGYLLAYAIAMTFMGKISDILGRRWVFLVSLTIFGFGSYLVAVADQYPTRFILRIFYLLSSSRPDVSNITLWLLIAARMIQAFGAGAMVPVGMALAGDLYSPQQRAKALGIIAAVDTSGWVVGHLYGGIIARYFDWRFIFWLNLPVCAVTFLLIYFLLSKIPPSTHTGRMDWIGSLLVSLFLICLSVGLGSTSDTTGISIGSQNTLPQFEIPYLIASVLFLFLLLLQQAKTKDSLIPLKLFTNKNFTSANLANFCLGVSLFIAFANVPLYINTLIADNLQQGAWDSGWLLSGLTVPMALASIPGGWLTSKTNYRVPALGGILLAIFGFSLMSTWNMKTPYALMIPHLMICGIGLGLTMAPVSTAVLNATPGAYRGIASSLLIIFRLVGMMVGVSSLATYGLQRANFLSIKLLTNPEDINEVAKVAVYVAEKVVSETFLIAAAVCILAIIPVLFLTKKPNEGDEYV